MTKAKNNGTLEKSYETSLQNSVKDVISKTEDAYNNIDDDNAKQALSNFYKNITELSKHIDNAVNSDSPTSGLVKYYTYVQQ